MTTPALSVSTPYGRLYRQPGTPISAVSDHTAALDAGLLMPSVTNVVSVGEKPYLRTWHAKLAAETAIETVQQHPGLIEAKPDRALRYLRDAAERKSTAAAELGTEVHRIVEHLARGEDAGDRWPQAAKYVDSWHAFVDDYQPEFLHIESTLFGRVDGSLPYAGTADFVARINGVVCVGDYKCGRSIHTEASLQAAALAHGTQVTDDMESLTAAPAVEAGLIVHLTPRGYRVHQADITGTSWEAFCGYRRVWDWHARNLASRAALHVSSPLAGPHAVVVERQPAPA